jgi:PKD repeat protein
MKRVLIPIIFLLIVAPAMSQGLVYVNGTVRDEIDSLPVVNHEVTIMSDSANGVVYYNVVLTDSAGHYFDNVPVNANLQGTLYIMTLDCQNFQHEEIIVYDSANYSFTRDFFICSTNIPCEANFTYYEYSSMTYQFQDLSLGNPLTWYWDFGDSAWSTEQNPLHYFSAEGWYTVTLSIGNQPAGCYDTYSMQIYASDSTGSGCQAYYTYYPVPEGSPDSFQFTDLSSGNIYAWSWAFGDGTFSQEQNPYHAFPGPGTYETCLTVTGIYNSDTFCSTIVISDTVYQQLYGQVFAGNFPLQSGEVFLYALNPIGGYTLLDGGWPLDSNGIYYFTLVPEGTYLIQAVPTDSNGYMPTYFGDVINWQQATQIVIGMPENPYNIHLVPAGPLAPGPGSVSGLITNGRDDRSQVDLINMLLMNESGEAIGFSSVSSQGSFDFRGMDYGIYYMRAELSGVLSDNMKFEITPEASHLDVVLNFSGNSVLGVEEEETISCNVSFYPNPVKDKLTVLLKLDHDSRIETAVFSIAGQLVYHDEDNFGNGENIIVIPFDRFPEGLYTVRLMDEVGGDIVRKIIKN